MVFCLFFSANAHGYIINGSVVDASTKKGISNVYVFINKTQKFAITDSAGNFTIDHVTENYFDIVAVHKAYKKIIHHFTPENVNRKIKFEFDKEPTDSSLLQPDSLQKNNLSKWWDVLNFNFIGKGQNTRCEVLNPEVLRFFFDPVKKELSVKATDQLMVINETLGYLISISVDEMVINTNYKVFGGHLFFKPLTSKSKDVKDSWDVSRDFAYRGSLLHFMRSVYANKVENEGFAVKKVMRVYENDLDFKKYASAAPDELNKSKGVFISDIQPGKTFIDVVLKQPVNISEYRKIDTADQSVLFVTGGKPLQILFKGKYLPYEYLETIGQNRFVLQKETSYLTTDTAVEIEPDGMYFDSANLLVDAYWGWLTMIAFKLPFDFDSAANQ